ncbi:hypothetical protein [Acetobacter oeni]|uniref:hypothetical protein n=1 Tax=Acetobacter oeni TaxID=304077 RepID=UPI0011BF129E|nr:hypothetical protein [Acetobacter oeni]MBB3882676.1 hypothetical protein [Acetobacter oeni]NHO18779.1 hypothetical protein [Acetobacter oeni]
MKHLILVNDKHLSRNEAGLRPPVSVNSSMLRNSGYLSKKHGGSRYPNSGMIVRNAIRQADVTASVFSHGNSKKNRLSPLNRDGSICQARKNRHNNLIYVGKPAILSDSQAVLYKGNVGRTARVSEHRILIHRFDNGKKQHSNLSRVWRITVRDHELKISDKNIIKSKDKKNTFTNDYSSEYSLNHMNITKKPGAIRLHFRGRSVLVIPSGSVRHIRYGTGKLDGKTIDRKSSQGISSQQLMNMTYATHRHNASLAKSFVRSGAIAKDKRDFATSKRPSETNYFESRQNGDGYKALYSAPRKSEAKQTIPDPPEQFHVSNVSEIADAVIQKFGEGLSAAPTTSPLSWVQSTPCYPGLHL